MTPSDLAALHARAFTDLPPPWSATAFAELIALPGMILATRPGGFALARVAGPEAELLTLAVAPDLRRRGLGAALLGEAIAIGAARGAEEMFLEVAETNAAARALYAAAGFTPRGRRRAYYARPGHAAVDALVLARPLTAP